MLTNLFNLVVLVGTGATILKTETSEPLEVLTKIIATAVWTTCVICAVLVAF